VTADSPSIAAGRCAKCRLHEGVGRVGSITSLELAHVERFVDGQREEAEPRSG
jgi:hypothetical protein